MKLLQSTFLLTAIASTVMSAELAFFENSAGPTDGPKPASAPTPEGPTKEPQVDALDNLPYLLRGPAKLLRGPAKLLKGPAKLLDAASLLPKTPPVITGIAALLNYCPDCDLGSVGRVQEKEYLFDEAGAPPQSMRYTLYVPKSYDPSKPTPMTVALHGLFGDPTTLYPMAPLAEKYGHILVCPMGYNKTSWFGAQEITSDMERKVMVSQAPLDVSSINFVEAGKLGYKDVMNVIQIVRKDYNVDPGRMYLAGHSMGGGGTYYIATKTPDMWAAIGTMAPGIAASAAYLDLIKHIPVICLQGLKDTIVPPFISKYWSETMKYLGMKHKYIEYQNADHMSIVLRSGELFKFFDEYRKE